MRLTTLYENLNYRYSISDAHLNQEQGGHLRIYDAVENDFAKDPLTGELIVFRVEFTPEGKLDTRSLKTMNAVKRANVMVQQWNKIERGVEAMS